MRRTESAEKMYRRIFGVCLCATCTLKRNIPIKLLLIVSFALFFCVPAQLHNPPCISKLVSTTLLKNVYINSCARFIWMIDSNCGAGHFSPATLLFVPSEELRCTCICIWHLNFSGEWSMTQFWMKRWRRRSGFQAHLMDAPFWIRNFIQHTNGVWNLSDIKLDVTYIDVCAKAQNFNDWNSFIADSFCLGLYPFCVIFPEILFNESFSQLHPTINAVGFVAVSCSTCLCVPVNATMLAASTVGISHFLRSTPQQKTRWHLIRSQWELLTGCRMRSHYNVRPASFYWARSC